MFVIVASEPSRSQVTEGGPSPKTSATKGAAIHCTTSGSPGWCGDGRGREGVGRYHLSVY